MKLNEVQGFFGKKAIILFDESREDLACRIAKSIQGACIKIIGEDKEMKKYTVFFGQWKRTNYQVKAKDEIEAAKIGRKLYQRDVIDFLPDLEVEDGWISESEGIGLIIKSRQKRVNKMLTYQEHSELEDFLEDYRVICQKYNLMFDDPRLVKLGTREELKNQIGNILKEGLTEF